MPANTSSFRVRLNRSLTAPASCAKMRWRMRRLKSGEGSELEVSGPGLAAALIQARLVDEIGVYISPMAVGGGKHFFATLEGPLELSRHSKAASCTCAARCRHNHVHWGALDSYAIKPCHPGQLPRKPGLRGNDGLLGGDSGRNAL